MNAKRTKEGGDSAGTGSTFGNTCRARCQKVLTQIRDTKASILDESREVLKVQEPLLKLALNEAEALAWQTRHPQLVFPALATEKIQAVADWNRHQRSVRRMAPVFALAE